MSPHGVLPRSLLRISTAGSVDDGKSTLIGRLLLDSESLYDDHIRSLEKTQKRRYPSSDLELALVTDGLKAEQEQGITIDVAYRHFATAKRRFILADTPGHEQYTRNMATGASTADVTIILIDASKGIQVQTRRHAYIASLMGVSRFVVAVNKMDLVDYSREVFERIEEDIAEFCSGLRLKDLRFVPLSALKGDNIIWSSERMSWYRGESLLESLENIYVAGDTSSADFRFPVQQTLRADSQYRGIIGQIASGVIHRGDTVVVLPSMIKTRVKSIETFTESLEEAKTPLSVTLVLEDNVDISRGDIIVREEGAPLLTSHFEAMIVWMDDAPLDPSNAYIIRHTTREARVYINEITYRVDVNSLSRMSPEPLRLNEIGCLSFTSSMPLALDTYERNRSTGSFILIDPKTFQTVAAGMVMDRRSLDSAAIFPVSRNLHAESGLVSREERELRLGTPARTIWCTGLSGSGKSTIARELERRLFAEGQMVYRLDGDNVRGGLNRDLGFSPEARSENIRRVAEVAKLFNDAGVTIICSFISPYRKDRLLAKDIIGADRFVELYLATPVEVCIERDPHGLYAKALAGEIADFTGINAPYEAPENADIVLDTSYLALGECIELILRTVGRGEA